MCRSKLGVPRHAALLRATSMASPPMAARPWLLLSLVVASQAAEVGVSASGQTEEVNPYSESGDSTQECYAWAADGQCRMNTGHMLTQCKYSCWEWFKHRREKYPDAPIDKQMDCDSWSKQGECGKNAAYMRAQCPESCKDVGYDPPPLPATEGKKKKKKRKGKKAKSLMAEDDE